MSQERLNMMRNYLSQKGWKVTSEDGFEDTKEIYKVYNQKLYWKLSNKDPKLKDINLEFFIFGDLGEDTNDLNDLVFCNKKDSTKRLYFSKINSESWRKEHKIFIDSLFSE